MRTLELTDFRNYESARVAFALGLNVVVGENGQGKTNLLEAIYVLCAHGSHRVAQLAPLVREGADQAVVRAKGSARGRRVEVDAQIRRAGGLSMRVNRVNLSGGDALEASIAAVLFSPEDLALTKGGPEERRRFLDHAAAQMRPLAGLDRQEFERVLRQRNGALKAAQSGSSRARESLQVWDEKLALTGSAVIAGRLEVLRRIAPRVEEHYRRLAGKGAEPVLAYRASWTESEPPTDPEKIAAALRSGLDSFRAKDMERGITHSGPHRDDLGMTLGGAEVRSFASQGEQRSLALAMRLAERDLLAEVRGEDPILLLDDVFSELDEHRRGRLGALIAGSGQTISTATGLVGLPVAPELVLRVEAGRVLADE